MTADLRTCSIAVVMRAIIINSTVLAGGSGCSLVFGAPFRAAYRNAEKNRPVIAVTSTIAMRFARGSTGEKSVNTEIIGC